MAEKNAASTRNRKRKLTKAPDGTEEAISGRHYVYLGYIPSAHKVRRSAIVSDVSSLFSRKGRNIVDEEAQSNLATILDEYKRISGYALVANQTSQDVWTFPLIRLKHELEAEVGESLERVKSKRAYDLYVSKTLDIKSANKSIDKYWQSVTNGFAVQSAIFVGMVTIFDEAIAKLIRNCLVNVPELMNSFGLQVSYKDVVAASDFDAFRRDIIDRTVNEIMWKSREEQIAWIEKSITKKKVSDVISAFDRFIEITERRNIYVHNSGIVNDIYLSKVPMSAFSGKQPEIGSRLRLNSTYFQSAADVLLEAYVIISQLVVRKLMRSASDTQKNTIDSQFNEAVYGQLEIGRHESSARLAKAMISDNFKISDLIKRMGIVNLAISLKKSNNNDELDKLLNDSDWSSSKTEFVVCVEAIKENDEKVYSLIPQIKGSDLITPQSYFDWPAFDWMRDKPKFWSTLQEVYGDDIRLAADDPAVQ